MKQNVTPGGIKVDRDRDSCCSQENERGCSQDGQQGCQEEDFDRIFGLSCMMFSLGR